jgi:hypothetical protein
LTHRKPNSVTQPGHGIWKIVDLYYNLSVLVDKSRAYGARKGCTPEELNKIDQLELASLTEDEFKEQLKE